MFITSTHFNLEDVKKLFLAYHKEIAIDLSFQDFEHELDHLPGKYEAPDGCIYVAYINDQAIGCVALRRYEGYTGEIKRLFVDRDHRKKKVAITLMEHVIQHARRLGYRYLVLDTLASMVPAITLYKKLGFYEIDAYYENPLNDVVYLKMDL